MNFMNVNIPWGDLFHWCLSGNSTPQTSLFFGRPSVACLKTSTVRPRNVRSAVAHNGLDRAKLGTCSNVTTKMSEEFEMWLQNLCDTFNSLTDIQRNTTVECIINLCGPEQLRFLSTKLELLVKRDYLKCLPLELSFHVLKWLDPVSLCRCCLVSKIWNKVILSCDGVWQNACKQLGLNVEEELPENSSASWKHVYSLHTQNIRKLKGERAVERKQLYGHTARVFALYYHGNYLATGEIIRVVNRRPNAWLYKKMFWTECSNLDPPHPSLRQIEGSFSKNVLRDACQPEVDFVHSWAVMLAKVSGRLSPLEWRLFVTQIC